MIGEGVMPWAYAGVVEALSWISDDWLGVLAVLLEGKLCGPQAADNCVYCDACGFRPLIERRRREWREAEVVAGVVRVIG